MANASPSSTKVSRGRKALASTQTPISRRPTRQQQQWPEVTQYVILEDAGGLEQKQAG
ncbi:MAG: hypothetical protein Q8N45_08580 [Anaerolineales bacterium]|nr:hypothetical protein [Anaerolineales bacterium]MDO9349279.1 hypothetical protein [Anaerolineales bacterium]MDP2976251.1 hypothetical protein [Anaerolineales bacterium]MDP3184409.1 hypothetical protein [Anaerolineales bacterium]